MTDNQDIKSGKTTAFISYFYLLGVLIAYLINSDKKSQFAYFHIRQSLGLWLTFLALGYPIGYFDNWQITTRKNKNTNWCSYSNRMALNIRKGSSL